MLNDNLDGSPQVATPATSATPEPLWSEGSSAPEYPLYALGVLEAPVRACAQMSKAHLVTAAQSVLAVATLAVQGLADVTHPNGNPIPVSLFFITVAKSGDGKTACDNFAAAPLRIREKELSKQYKENLKHKESDSSLPNLPFPILTCAEPTFEGLCKALKDGYPNQGIFTDDGGQFLGGHGMNHEAKLRTLTNLSVFWDGNSVKRVRAGEPLLILEGKRVSMHLMVQPSVAQMLLGDELSNSQGFTSRCLVSYPTTMAGKRFYEDSTEELEQTLDQYNEHMLRLFRMSLPIENPGNWLNPRQLSLTATQKERWKHFQHQVERMRDVDGPYDDISGFSAKISEHVLRLSAVFTIVENPQAQTVADKALENSITLAQFYLEEALRLQQQEVIPLTAQDAMKILRFLQRRPVDSFAMRDILKDGPNSLRKYRERIEKAIHMLIAKKWVKAPSAKGGLYYLLHR